MMGHWLGEIEPRIGERPIEPASATLVQFR